MFLSSLRLAFSRNIIQSAPDLLALKSDTLLNEEFLHVLQVPLSSLVDTPLQFISLLFHGVYIRGLKTPSRKLDLVLIVPLDHFPTGRSNHDTAVASW